MGMTSNKDFNGLDKRLWEYLLTKNTTITMKSRNHVCFGTMQDDGMLDHFADTQIAIASQFLRDDYHNGPVR